MGVLPVYLELGLLTAPVTAFILFRQHSQPAILTQKPGLSNPEISKIIGNQWRLLPSEAKQEWKDLAEVILFYFSSISFGHPGSQVAKTLS